MSKKQKPPTVIATQQAAKWKSEFPNHAFPYSFYQKNVKATNKKLIAWS